MTGPMRLREREVLTAQLARCNRVGSSFNRGAVAALRWLTEGGPAPLTGTMAAPVSPRAMVAELAAAEAVIYGHPCEGREYAAGVEHALMWAEFATAGPPVHSEPSTRSRGTHA